MKEKFKEWLLRWLVRDLLGRNYGIHLMHVIVQENAAIHTEDNTEAQIAFMYYSLEMGLTKHAIEKEPLL